MTTWVEVLVAMVHGPERSLRGVITTRDAATAPGNELGWAVVGDRVPVLTGGDGDRAHRVWRDGRRLRVERLDGVPVLIADDERAWRFDQRDAAPVEVRRDQVRSRGDGTHLLTRRDANEFAGDDFTRPTGPPGGSTFLGRPAWTVELAPPARKPHPLQLVVDAETGVVLQQRVDAVGAVDEWTEIAVGEPLDPALFSWTGPVRTRERERVDDETRHEAQREAGRSWFAEHVGPTDLTAEVTVDLSVDWLHTHDPVTGAFEAGLGRDRATGTLARRARSAASWDRGWNGRQHEWHTTTHDWAVMLLDHTLTPDALAALQRQLGAVPQE